MQPIMLGDAALANRMAAAMLERGVYVVGFSYPVVPKGMARIRVQLSAGGLGSVCACRGVVNQVEQKHKDSACRGVVQVE